jgi:PAS domain S-box-containing protein
MSVPIPPGEERDPDATARDAAHRLRLAMRAARMADWEWDIERDRITWSDEAASLLGIPTRRLPRRVRDLTRLIHPDDRRAFEQEVASVGRVPGSAPVRLVHRVLTGDGGVRWFEEHAEYFPGADGRGPRVIGVVFDVTDRRRSEELLLTVTRGVSSAVGEDFFRSLVSHLAGGLGTDFAFVGEIVGADASRVRTIAFFADGRIGDNFEYRLEGAPCAAVVGGGQCSYPDHVREQFPEDEGLRRLNVESYAGQPLLDSAGRPLGLLVVMSRAPLEHASEVESVLRVFGVRASGELERLRTEEQLRQSQKMEMVGQLAGGVAHDFNNLLSPILGYSEKLLARAGAEGPQREELEAIRDAALRAAGLTRQLLSFSRRQLLDVRTFDLNDVVHGFAQMLRHTLRENILVDVRRHPDPLPVRADTGQIEQVLMNLAVNAQDAIAGDGRITIALGETVVEAGGTDARGGLALGPYATLEVRDTGAGMEPAVRDRAFEPFFTTKISGRGTGLGLPTVYAIVRQHQGAVTVESQPGRGSCFRVLLPKAAGAADVAVPVATAAAFGGSETVIVVEDDAPVRRFACAVLREAGYHVIEFGGPAECLDASERDACQADLLLTDVVMRGLDGRTLYARMRARCPSLKVLYMSGYPDTLQGETGLGASRPDFLPKPFSVDALASRVRKSLDTDGPGVLG